jgi:pilus assembly protein Flp/PilA
MVFWRSNFREVSMLKKIQLMRRSVIDLRAERKSERGATATEYSLLIAFMVLAMVAGVTFFGGRLGALFTSMGGVVGLWPN